MNKVQCGQSIFDLNKLFHPISNVLNNVLQSSLLLLKSPISPQTLLVTSTNNTMHLISHDILAGTMLMYFLENWLTQTNAFYIPLYDLHSSTRRVFSCSTINWKLIPSNSDLLKVIQLNINLVYSYIHYNQVNVWNKVPISLTNKHHVHPYRIIITFWLNLCYQVFTSCALR